LHLELSLGQHLDVVEHLVEEVRQERTHREITAGLAKLTCAVLMARFGRPMSPSNGPVIASGIINGQPTCSFAEPWLTQLRGLASITLPKVDVLVSF
jgi:hypothetical protein